MPDVYWCPPIKELEWKATIYEVPMVHPGQEGITIPCEYSSRYIILHLTGYLFIFSLSRGYL